MGDQYYWQTENIWCLTAKINKDLTGLHDIYKIYD